MTTQHDFVKYNHLERKLAAEIEKVQGYTRQEMPEGTWEDEKRRMEWISQDKAQWNHNRERLAQLRRLYDRCFPKKEWVIFKIEKFFRDEEGPLY